MSEETVSKELPEGWRKRHQAFFERSDGAYVYYELDNLPYVRWVARQKNGHILRGYRTAKTARAALDREYPMEKQHGEK